MNTPTEVLGRRALNRALLQRQHLLTRATSPAIDLVEHLVGLQAQAPLAPYVGLWTRLDGFDAAELVDLLTSRRLVRSTLMRGTVHLVSDTDCLLLRPLLEAMIEQRFHGHYRRAMTGVDTALVTEAGRELLEQQPRTRAELRSLLGARWPEHDADALSYAVGYLVDTVQVTPRGLWGRTGPAAHTTIGSWLGRPLDPAPSADPVVRRYLAAYGPATVRDVQQWSGLTRLREVVDRLDLRGYVDADGNQLYDVPEAVLPDPETPAPVRFLPEYDNVLLSHADRRRIIPDGRRVPLPPGNGAAAGTVLVDGSWRATWRIRRGDDRVLLEVEPFAALSRAELADVTAEGAALLTFTDPDTAGHDVRIRVSADRAR